MKKYEIGSKLECLEDLDAGYLNASYSNFIIPKGTIVTISDSDHSEFWSCYLLDMNVDQKMKDLNPNILVHDAEMVSIWAWNDEDVEQVDKHFKLI